MKKILVVKNITREGPGLITDVLDERGIRIEIVDLSRGEKFPDPAGYSAVIVLGGPDSANDGTEKMRNELARVRECLKMNKPFLGICLGLQVMVKAAGGEVVKSPVKEVGFFDDGNRLFEVALTEAGRADSLFEGLRDPFHVFQLHGETVVLGKGMTLLGTDEFCPNQIVRTGQNAYGIQSHFELTAEMLRVWLEEDNDLKVLEHQGLKAWFESFESSYRATGRALIRNFLKVAGVLD